MKNSLLAKAALIAAASMVLGVGCHKHRPIEGEEPQVQAQEENKLESEVRANYEIRYSSSELAFASRVKQIGLKMEDIVSERFEGKELSFTILMNQSSGLGMIELSARLKNEALLAPVELTAKLIGRVEGLTPASKWSTRCMDADCKEVSVVSQIWTSADAMKANEETPVITGYIFAKGGSGYVLQDSVGGAENLAGCLVQDYTYLNSQGYLERLKRDYPSPQYTSQCVTKEFPARPEFPSSNTKTQKPADAKPEISEKPVDQKPVDAKPAVRFQDWSNYNGSN